MQCSMFDPSTCSTKLRAVKVTPEEETTFNPEKAIFCDKHVPRFVTSVPIGAQCVKQFTLRINAVKIVRTHTQFPLMQCIAIVDELRECI